MRTPIRSALPLLLLGLPTALGAQGSGAKPTPLVEIRGLVVDAGKPVAGAELWITRQALPIPDAESAASQRTVVVKKETDADGRFQLQHPAWGSSCLWVRKGERVSGIVELRDRSAGELRIELQQGQRCGGELRYRRRKPGLELPYRLIRLSAEEGAPRVQFEGTVGKDGNFTSEPLPPGDYQLKLGAAKYRLRQPTILKAGERGKISLARAIQLKGRIVAGDGLMARPIAGVAVELLSPVTYSTATSAADGSVTIGGLEEGPGATLLLMPDPSLGNWERDIQATLPGIRQSDPEPHFEIQLQPGREATGTILDSFGNPAKGVTVLARCFMHKRGINANDLSVTAETDEKGRYKIRGIHDEGGYDVLAISPEGEGQHIARIEPKDDGGAVSLPSFTLGSHRVRAELGLAAGIVPADVELRLYGPKRFGTFHEYRSLIRMPDGAYLSPSVPYGEYAVFAFSKINGFARATITIRQNEGNKPVHCLVTLAKPRELSGVVVDVERKPVAGASVKLVPFAGTPDGGFRDWHDFVANQVFNEIRPNEEYLTTVQTDANGRYSVTCYEASGNYDLFVTRSSGNPGEGSRHRGVLGRQNPIVIEIP